MHFGGTFTRFLPLALAFEFPLCRCPLALQLLHSFGLDLPAYLCGMQHSVASAQCNGQAKVELELELELEPSEYATHALNCRCFISLIVFVYLELVAVKLGHLVGLVGFGFGFVSPLGSHRP